MDGPLRVVSYGGGVQSSAIVLMSIAGEIERPDVVIFADTGSETPSTYSTVEYVKSECEKAGLEFCTVYADFQRDGVERENRIEGYAPLHEWYQYYGRLPMVGNPRCTFNFKIYPVRREVKRRIKFSNLDKGPKPHAICSLGITTDESHRARDSQIQWMSSVYPLIERDISRRNCITWLEKNHPSHSFSKSGCFCCMYQPPSGWKSLKKNHPELFDIALEMERTARANGVKRGLWGTRSIEAFNHDVTLEDFGFSLHPEDFECGAVHGGCFL